MKNNDYAQDLLNEIELELKEQRKNVDKILKEVGEKLDETR